MGTVVFVVTHLVTLFGLINLTAYAFNLDSKLGIGVGLLSIVSYLTFLKLVKHENVSDFVDGFGKP